MTEATRAALDDIIDAFKRGDHARLAARYDDDITWLFHAPVTVFPFAGVRRGKTDVLTGLLAVYQSYQIVKYNVSVIVVDGDRAATISDVHVVQKATGRVITARIGAFHRFHGGKLIDYCAFIDSFDTAEQALGREFDV